MGLSIAIIGLPNVGKSTLFNALTKNKVPSENYPFCTIDPNVGVVAVPDERLNDLAKIVGTEKIIPAVVEFVDIAGLVKGANKGEGLGNKFLANIRECDAIAEVVRGFSDKNVTHVSGGTDPKSDIETIKTELALADLETVEKAVARLEKEVKVSPKEEVALNLALRVKDWLSRGNAVREMELADEEKEILREYHLLTAKPHIYVLNVDEEHIAKDEFNVPYGIKISAKIESELSDLPPDEVGNYLKELGLKESGLNILIKKAYELLGLKTFFTAGEKEVRAWTIHRGARAPEAAGVIHTDFEKGFIRAEVIPWKDLIESGGWIKAREQGNVRTEGKDYIVQEGDVIIFKV